MGKYLRTFIALIVILSLVLLASNNAAWASGSNGTSPEQTSLSASLGHKGDCDEENDQVQNKNKCKDKDDKDDAEDDDGEADDEDDDNGSVKPPDDEVEACNKGSYSVGGMATVDVRNLRKQGCLKADIQDAADLGSLPNGTILSGALVLQFPPGGGKVKVCFAAPPGSQNIKIQAFVNGSWKPLKTKVKNGIVCTEVSRSGAYTLTGQ